MCPITKSLQLLIVIFTLILICRAVIVRSVLNVNFKPNNVKIYMYDTVNIQYNATATDDTTDSCTIYSENPYVASISNDVVILNSSDSGSFSITGNFLGETIISCKSLETNNSQILTENNHVKVKCLRKQRTIDKIFTISVAVLVAIIYINFGSAMEWNEVKDILRKPIGPAVGLFGHFVLMPIFSYFIGYFLFPNNPAMRLGLFFTGVSPAGGASNVWTAVLNGNIELSIIMSTISTIGSFAFMPLWLFTLGKTIFKDAQIKVPYAQISNFVFALIIPLTIGYLINRYLKRIGAFLKRILNGFSVLLILFIIIFAIVTNLYLFELFSWKIIIASTALPWLGYIAGYCLAKIFKQPHMNALTIGIEVGLQNTGIAIYLLRFTLEELHADLTTVIPVSVAIMTPIPLVIIYFYKTISRRCKGNEKDKDNDDNRSQWSPKPISIHDANSVMDYYRQPQHES